MVKVLIKTDTRYPVNRKVVRKAVLEVLRQQKMENLDVEISVAVVGERKMRALTGEYFGDSEKHEVIAFPLLTDEPRDMSDESSAKGFINPPDDILRLGDIVICWPWLLEVSSQDDELVDKKLYFLVGHAMEHLLGKHHE